MCDVGVALVSRDLGSYTGGFKGMSPSGRAALEGSPLVVDMPRDGETTREPDPSESFNSGVEVIWGSIGIDISKEV